MIRYRFLNFLLFSWFLFIGCKTHSYVADIDTSYDRVGYWNDHDSDMEDLISPYKEKLDASMYEVIAYNETEMKKARPNSALGSWFCDVIMEAAHKEYGHDISFSVQNYGGLRIPMIAKGDVTVGKIYELMPFDNELVIVKISGDVVQQLLDLIASHGGWPVSSQLDFTIEADKAVDINIGGKPLEKGKIYQVAIADYIANGGDNAFFLKNAEREDKDILIRDLIISYLKSRPEGERNISTDNPERIKTK